MQFDLVRTEGDGTPGMLFQAEKAGKRPGIVLLQEIFGLNSSMVSIARQFQKCGFDVFAPDLFWHQEEGVRLDPTQADDRARAEGLMKGLNEKDALEDIASSVQFLRSRANASGAVAAVGYCLGGRLAYLAAAHGLVDAAVSYYGVAVHRSLDLADRVTVPFLMHVAEQDHLCDAQAQQDLRDQLGERGNFDLRFHPDVGHAFARPNSPMWNEAAAEQANAVTFRFLSDALGDT